MVIRDRIERLLNVRPDEWGDLVFFWIFNTFLWTGLSLGESVSEAMFLKRVGVDFLPHMFILCSLFAIPVSFLFAGLQNRLGRIELSVGVSMGSILLVLFCAYLIHGDFTVFSVRIGYPFLYIVQNSLATILATNFSILLSSHFLTLDAKRLVPLILSGNVAGCIMGGFILNSFSTRLGVVNLLWIWVLLLVASLAWFLIFCIKVFPSTWGGEEREIAPRYVAESWLDRIVLETRAVLGSPLLVLLAVSTLGMTLTRFFIEYQYCDIFGAHFPKEEDLARFFGMYTIVSNVLALGVQSFITSRMIQTLGVSNANLFFPVSTALCFVGTAISYSLVPGVYARFNQEGIRRAVFQPVSNLFYNAIPAKRRARSIAFNEGLVVPIGSVLAGIILMLLKDDRFLFTLFCLLLSVGWVALAWVQRSVYSQSLLELLKKSQIENLNQDEKDLGTFDAQTQVLVVEALKDEQDEVAELAADLLIRYGSASAKLALLRQASTSRTSLQILLIRRLANFPGPDTKDFLLKCLKGDDEEVKLAVLEALITYPHDDQIRLLVGEFLEYKDRRHKAAAAAGVVRGGDLVQMMKALLILQQLTFSRKPEEVLLGIKTLGSTRDERFWVNLRGYLVSPKPELRLAAMRAMNLMVRAGEIYEHLDMLQTLLKDSVREIRSLAIQIVGRVKVQHSISLLIEAISDPSPRNRRHAIAALSNFGHEIVPELLMLLDDPKAMEYAQEGAVRLLSYSQDPIINERLTQFGFQKIRMIYELKMDEETIRTDIAGEAGDFLASVLGEKATGHLKVVLALVAPEQNQAARMVFKNLYSSNQEMMSNAIEILQNMGERTLIYHILPVLENLPLRHISEYGARVFQIERRTARMVLGRHLLSLDQELREAAIYTIGQTGMKELAPAIRKLRNSETATSQLAQLCDWTLDQLGKQGIFSPEGASNPRLAGNTT